MKRLRKFLLVSLGMILAVLLLTNLWVVYSTNDKVYQNSEDITKYEVGLVLGTSNKISSGEENPFFTSRIEAAVELYKAGKVKYLIVSGDNRSKYYNEPLKMQQALVERGVPKNVITLDYAGLRTLDSVVRCKEIFGQNDVIIISQGFHCYRALFIGNYHGMNTAGFATENIPISQSFKIVFREILARPVAVWDTYLISKRPKHLGKSELINRGEI